MTDTEQTEAFRRSLDALTNNFIDEFDLTYEQILGVLVLKQAELCKDALGDTNENEDEDEDEDEDDGDEWKAGV